MDIQLTKLELIEMLLNTKRESILKEIKVILETEENNNFLTEKQYQKIDERRDNYLNGKGKSLSWNEVKQDALKIL